jgi:hypothetical protein
MAKMMSTAVLVCFFLGTLHCASGTLMMRGSMGSQQSVVMLARSLTQTAQTEQPSAVPVASSLEGETTAAMTNAPSAANTTALAPVPTEPEEPNMAEYVGGMLGVVLTAVFLAVMAKRSFHAWQDHKEQQHLEAAMDNSKPEPGGTWRDEFTSEKKMDIGAGAGPPQPKPAARDQDASQARRDGEGGKEASAPLEEFVGVPQTKEEMSYVSPAMQMWMGGRVEV